MIISHYHLLEMLTQSTCLEVSRENGSDAQIIAKIEDHKGVHNLEEIIKASDAIMVARGDLGIECALEELPIIQRKAVGACLAEETSNNRHHMLESMIESPVPTRAEKMWPTQSMRVQTVLCSAEKPPRGNSTNV